jgi:putative transposase
MGRHTSIIYQIVYSTKYRTPCLDKEIRPELFKYIWGILKNKKCHLYRMNGVEDHLHIVMDLHPTIALSNLIKDIKLASSKMIKEKNLIKNFLGWQIGYGAFTYSINEKENLIEYVKNQEEHHKKITFREEYISLLNEYGIEYDERYLFED